MSVPLKGIQPKVVILIMLTFISLQSCYNSGNGKEKSAMDEEYFAQERAKMVEDQIIARGVKDELVLDAMREVARHKFVPKTYRDRAYQDTPLPIGHEQTISQPYIVAFMTELLELKSGATAADGANVLEIGTGLGYQAAVLSKIAGEVYTIEIVKELAESAKERLEKMGYKNITVKWGDGYQGWKEHAPFDGIIVTAAPDHIPQPLIDQLKVGGRMVIPVGEEHQELVLMTKDQKGITRKNIIPVRFVPMTGEAEDR